MSKRKKPTEQTQRKKVYFVPRKKGPRIQWAANLQTKIQQYGAMLGLTAAETTASAGKLGAYLLAENDLANSKVTQKNKSKAVSQALKDLKTDVLPKSSRMKKHTAYTSAIGKDMGVEGGDHVAQLDSVQSFIRKIFIDSGVVKLFITKGDAEAFNVYVRIKGQTTWTLIGQRIKYSPFADERPLASPGVSETREYKVHGVLGDREIGLDSDITGIIYGG